MGRRGEVSIVFPHPPLLYFFAFTCKMRERKGGSDKQNKYQSDKDGGEEGEGRREGRGGGGIGEKYLKNIGRKATISVK